MTNQMNQRARRLTTRAYRHLLWETYAPVLALAALFVCLYLIGAFSSIWQRIGDPWRLIALLVAIGVPVMGIRIARKQLPPTRSQAKRRVEQDSGLQHRPLDTIVDSPVGDSQASAVWSAHKHRAHMLAQNAAPSQLRPVLATKDRYFLRFLLPFALVLACMVGAGDNWERVRASLLPIWQHGMNAKTAQFEAWVDPPEYTRRPPSYFKGAGTRSAPEGSEFVARISGIRTAPRLLIHENGQTRRITPKRLGPKSFEARAIVNRNAKAGYRIGSLKKIWGLNIETDRHPEIEFSAGPGVGKRDRLIFTYSLEDDFGVEALNLVFALENTPEVKETVPVILPGSVSRKLEKESASLDLTKHKWAGKKVLGYLAAIDGKGQIGTTESRKFLVPDKVFVEPLAKVVVEHRSLILASDAEYAAIDPLPDYALEDLADRPMFAVDRPDRTIKRAPEPVQRAALLIDAVTNKPVGIIQDPVVYLGLRNIHRRLLSSRSQADLEGIPEDLWDIALRAEFGLLGDALENMRTAERALNNAMARRAPQREIDALFDRYNAAVDRYMEELMKQAIEEAKNRAGDQDSSESGDTMREDEIQALLDAIEEANRLGDPVAARKALAQLAQLLENLKIQLAQGSGSGEGPSDGMSEELKEALEELYELLGEQRQLRDETGAAGRKQQDEDEKSGQNGQDTRSGGQLAEDQQRLRQMLKRMENSSEFAEGDEGQTGVGEDQGGEGTGLSDEKIRDSLETADRAMRESEDALKNSDFFRAGRAQSDAIKALRATGETLFATEARRIAERKSENGENGQGEVDPFGRDNNGNSVDNQVEIPDIDDRKRARDLLRELRRRYGEQDRKQLERDYLDRLLERF